MGEDTRTADARRREESGLRTSGIAARRAAGDPGETGSPGDGIGPVELDELALQEWARTIGASARTPLVLALRGDLGAGKSVFARALARGAGVHGALPSPTFNLLFRYDSPRGITISHLDLYRLEDPEEVWELGWRELGDGNEIAMIEWPERAEDLLPRRRWDIFIKPGTSEDTRLVTAQPRNGPAPLPPPRADS